MQRNLVQPSIQQERVHKYRQHLPKTNRQALPEKVKAAQNLQQKHNKNELQLYAKHREYNQSPQQETLNKQCKCGPKALQSINLAFSTGVYPGDWKLAKIRPLFKKGDRTVFENYRPIYIYPQCS